jgi:hypothetical protein
LTIETLTRQAHAHLRIDPAKAATAAASVHLVPLVASEIRTVTSQFPIFFAKDEETGQFYPAALLGLAPHENLFWNGEALEADHLPLNLLRLPFFVGEGGAVCIDMASPAITPDGPCAITADDGSDSDYFAAIQAMLARLLQGQQPTRSLVDLALALKLITEIKLDLTFNDGSTSLLTGLYGVDENALSRAYADIEEFATVMDLAAMALSLNHVAGLVRRKNARLAAHAQWFTAVAS